MLQRRIVSNIRRLFLNPRLETALPMVIMLYGYFRSPLQLLDERAPNSMHRIDMSNFIKRIGKKYPSYFCGAGFQLLPYRSHEFDGLIRNSFLVGTGVVMN